LSREYLGRGWAFPVRPRKDGGGVDTTSHERNIVESIQLILNTQPGERQMLPEFGCGLQDLIFNTNTPQTRHDAESMIRAALAQWEPRIDVDKVTAKPDPADNNRIRVGVEYTVRKSNTHQNLVHLLQLQEFYDAD
jgi:uncharacterized protein